MEQQPASSDPNDVPQSSARAADVGTPATEGVASSTSEAAAETTTPPTAEERLEKLKQPGLELEVASAADFRIRIKGRGTPVFASGLTLEQAIDELPLLPPHSPR